MFTREILPRSPSSNSTIMLPSFSFSSSPGPPEGRTQTYEFQEQREAVRGQSGCLQVHLTTVDVARVKAARAFAPVSTHSGSLRQDNLRLGSHV